MEIHKTIHYDNFKLIVSNREVDKGHVKKLAASIQKKNLLQIRPVIVNSAMQVIDGQHRIEACRLIGQPVYYIIVDGLTKDDIAILNTAQKNWSGLDFINFYAIEGKPEYKRLSKLINKYPVKVSLFRQFCENAARGIRDGDLKISRYDRCVQVCDWIMDLRNQGYDFALERDFGRALDEVIDTDYRYAQLVTNATPERFTKCYSHSEYRRMLNTLVV